MRENFSQFKFLKNPWLQVGLFVTLFFATTLTTQAATITVNSLLTTVANDALCTLPEAITSANNNAAGTTNCTAGSGTDIIDFSVSGTIDISGANLTTITSPMTIDGGSNITIDALNTASRRIFNITGTTAVTIQNIILTDGRQTNGGCILASTATTLTLTNMTLDDCHATGGGGAIYFPDGTNPSVNMTNVTLLNNTTDGDGGAIYADDGTDVTATNLTATGNQAPNGTGAVIYYNSYGVNASNVVITGTSTIENSYALYGAIYLRHDDGHVISGATFQNNVCGNAGTFQAGNGGAMLIDGDAEVTISNSIFDTNITNYFGSGGAIDIFNSPNTVIEDSTFITNESDYGGALHISEGNVTLRRNAFIGNEAVDEGGAIYFSESGGGGPTVSVENNTFYGNIANSDGGGAIRNRFGDVTIYNNTFTDNSTPGNGAVILVDSGSQTDFANNIFEDNTGTGTCAVNTPVSFTNQGFNLFDSATGCDPQGSDFTGTTANLGTLATNGGITLNRLPGAGDAVDNASATYAPAEDQRAISRPVGPADDIGSVEVSAPPDTTPPVLAEVTPVPTPTNDNTPNYTFSSDEAGTIGYGGDCSSATSAATIGNNTVTFNTLSDGLHNNCTITVTDAATNQSLTLNVTAFTVDTAAPTLAEITPVSTPTMDTTPDYTFSSNEVGTISYGGDCSSATTSATSGNNTVTFNALSIGPHTNCTVTVTDAAGNPSSPLSVTAFTIIPTPNPPQGRIIFQNDDFATVYSDSLLINSDDEAAGNITIQFGSAIAETLSWNPTDSHFDLSNTLDLNNNELTSFRTENAAAFPGGGGGLGGGGTGRLIMLTTTDSTAPGCTVSNCIPGIYVWSGTAWIALFSTGAPGGNTNDVQYNDGSALGGEDAFEYDAATNQLTAPGVSVNEDFSLTGDISPAQLTADQNDYNPTGLATASVIRLDGDASFRTITGLAGGSDGRIVMLHNIGANTILLANQSTASTATNRFSFGGNDLPLYSGDLLELQYDSTSGFWRTERPDSHFIPPARAGIYHYHDMLGITTDTAISSQVTGTGATNSATAVTSEPEHPGIVQHTTGTVATGRAGMLSINPNGILLGNSWYWRFEGMIRINTLSVALQRYTYRLGFIDTPSAEPTDGVYFRYIDNVNTGQWQLVCRSNGTETATNSAAAPAASTWYRMTIIVNPAGNNAEFFINGTSIGTCATNLPTGAGRGTGFGSNIFKSVGTTAATIDLDYLEIVSYANTF